MPPFLINTFIDALHSCSVSAKFVAEGEADAVCVAVAEEKGGFVMGNDSDFLILGAASGTAGGPGGYRGYIPFDMVQWIEGPPSDAQPDGARPSSTTADEFIAVPSRRRATPSHRPSPFLPSPHLVSPSLAILYFTPQSLRTRLRLPTSVFPLFAALVGNDRSHPTASACFFDTNSAASDRIDKVASVLREALFALAKRATPPQPRSMNGTDTPGRSPGDQALELVELAMKKLAIRPPPNDVIRAEILNSIIDSTFQYILPSLHDCCSLYPFCGRVGDHGLCSSFKHSDGITVYKPGPAAGLFAKASRDGLIPGLLAGWLHPDRIYPRALLEDPQGPGLRMSEGLRHMRAVTWSLVEQGIGELQWDLEPGEEEEDEGMVPMTPLNVDEDVAEVLRNGTVSDPISDSDEIDNLKDIVEKLTIAESSQPTANAALEKDEAEDEGYKAVTEFIRQGSSIKLTPVPLLLPPIPSSPLWSSAALPLEPLANRQAFYLHALQSLTPAIQSLPTWLQPLVATLRCTIIETSRRGHAHKPDQHWKRKEAELCLKAGVGSWGIRRRQLEDEAKGKPDVVWDGQVAAVDLLLQTRNVDLLSHLTATMVDSHLLAQALLLVPEFRGARDLATATLPQLLGGTATAPVPKRQSRTDEVYFSTFASPWVFFNGHIHHLVMLGKDPSSKMGWKWGEKEAADMDLCWRALSEDLPEYVIKHWGVSERPRVVSDPVAVSTAVDKIKAKERRKATKAVSTSNLQSPGGGRFDLLSSLGMD
jgi:hypothetical protein